MLIAIILILGAVSAVLALRVYSLEKDIRSVARQLQAREAVESSSRLRLEAPNATAEDLLTAINALLERGERDKADYRQQEKAIRQQIANVSHDLRTPLTSILGYLQLLEGDTLTPEERREYLSVVQSRAKSLQSLITSFYDLSRLEGDEYPLVKEPVDLYGVLSRLVAEFYNDFIDGGFDMEVALSEGLPPVAADPSGVQRVLTNLIRNALEHGRERLSIRLFREENAVLAVFSNGVRGLCQEDVDHVFDRFYTADKTRTGQSTGLGLAIVQTLTQRMGHTVSADLAGETFTVTVRFRT